MMWRSLLYVPANVAAFLGKAQTRGADALILDLEDSVPVDQKAAARDMVAEHWTALVAGPSDIVVRINAPLSAAVRDLEAVVRPGLAALYLPKVTGPDHVRLLSEAVTELEHAGDMEPGGVRLIPMIETPGALEAAFDIAKACPRVVGLTLGGEDLATVCQMAVTPEALLIPRQRIVMAARAAGISPLGLLDSPANLDSSGLPELAKRSRLFGFDGATVVHPGAVAAINQGFAPDAAEIAEAKGVLEAMRAAGLQGRASARYRGRMIDTPMRQRAENTLARAGVTYRQ